MITVALTLFIALANFAIGFALAALAGHGPHCADFIRQFGLRLPLLSAPHAAQEPAPHAPSHH